MFTGIIESIGSIVGRSQAGTNVEFIVESSMTTELKVDQSVSHNGVCLTVTKLNGPRYHVTAVDETLKKTNLGDLTIGAKVNLERCMLNNGRFDGHIVQGHIDQVGVVRKISDNNGSWIFDFEYDEAMGNVTVEKGSIAINGVSLTCYNCTRNSFSVAIIPFTFEHTNFHQLRVGDRVNLEFDVIGKYVKRLLSFSR